MKIKDKEKIEKILFITLSNIGDIVLTMPVLSVLRKYFPKARIDVISGPNGQEIFSGHPFVSALLLYDKFSNMNYKRRLIKELRKNRYDLIVDLRNSLFPLLIGSRYRTSFLHKPPRRIKHKRDEHLWKLKKLGLKIDGAPFCFYIDGGSENFIQKLLTDSGIKKDFAVICPGAKSHIKRWTGEGFALVSDWLIEKAGLDVVMAGDSRDKKIVLDITSRMKNKAHDFTSRFNLRQLGALIKRSRLLLTNDSAPLHIGCAVAAKVLAIFGPTNPKRYGPTEKGDAVIRKELDCSPCEVAQCRKNHECMELISAEEVIDAAKGMLGE